MDEFYENTLEDDLIEENIVAEDLSEQGQYEEMLEMEYSTWVVKKGRKIVSKINGELKQKEIDECNKKMDDFWNSITESKIKETDKKEELRITLPERYYGIYSIYPKKLMDEYMTYRLKAIYIIENQIIIKDRTKEEQEKVKKYIKTYGNDEQYKNLDNECRIFNLIKSLIKNIDNREQITKIANEIFEYFATPILIRFVNNYYKMNIKTKKVMNLIFI